MGNAEFVVSPDVGYIQGKPDLLDPLAWEYPGIDYPNKRYFVNNVSGDSGADGTNWTNAMDEPSTAITAWEAYRAGLATNDQNVRGQIFVQGTGTPYTEITALPSYCDLIAVGADPRGNGAGIARIGADTGTGESGLSGTSSARGLYMRGFQFQAGKDGYAFQMSNIFRSKIVDCVFATNGVSAGQPAAGFQVAIASGLYMRDCMWLNQSSYGNVNALGFNVTSTHFHGCQIVDCHISGTTAAVQIASGCINNWASQFKSCTFDGGGGTCAVDVIDNATVGRIKFVDCRSEASANYDMAHNGAARVIGCIAANAYVTAS